MTREEFTHFVEETIEEVICLAEQKCGKALPRSFAFRWLGRSQPLVTDDAVENIIQRVFVDEDHIYPCVDIGVGDVLEDGSLLIVGSVAGYAPRRFGKNWTGRNGPFIHTIGGPFLNRMAGKPPGTSVDGIFAYSIPDMKHVPAAKEDARQIARDRARQIARMVLEEQIGILEATRAILPLLHQNPEIASLKDYNLFRGLDSETDDLPIGRVREEWHSQALLEKDREIARCEDLWRERVRSAFERILSHSQ